MRMDIFPSRSKKTFSTGGLSPLSLDGVFYHTLVTSAMSEPPAYLGQKLSASSHPKKGKKKKVKIHRNPPSIAGVRSCFKLNIKIPLHWN